MEELERIVEQLEARVAEYKKGRNNISEHIVSVEIALSLCKLYLKIGRKIRPDELHWFQSAYYLDFLLGGSPWEDIIELYNKLNMLIVEKS